MTSIVQGGHVTCNSGNTLGMVGILISEESSRTKVAGAGTGVGAGIGGIVVVVCDRCESDND